MELKELLAKIQEDSALAEKFKKCKNLDDVIEVAGKEGFEISEEELEELADISDDDLVKAAGGIYDVICHVRLENPSLDRSRSAVSHLTEGSVGGWISF